MSLEVHFIVAQEDGISKKFKLKTGEYVIVGRSQSRCQVSLADPMCSGTHCKVSVTKKAIFVEDLNSKNGLYLNEVAIIKQNIYIDDRIRLGNSLLFINHSRMDEKSIKIARYEGTDLRAGNLTLELELENNRPKTKSPKDSSKLYSSPRQNSVTINPKYIPEAPDQSRSYLTRIMDLLLAALVLGGVNFTCWRLFPASYGAPNAQPFYKIFFQGEAVKFTIASFILVTAFHIFNTRYLSASISERLNKTP